MSIKKIALGFALAGIVGATNAVAEQSGSFFGVQGGYGKAQYTIETTSSAKADFKGARFGIVAGKKGFLNDYFGIRSYILGDYGVYKYTEIETFKISTFNLSANLDVLFNFLSSDNFDLGIFAGVGLGYAFHTMPLSDMMTSGIDAGVNLGVRGSIAQEHSIEFYTRFNFIEQEIKSGYPSYTEKVGQPFQAGIRYIYTFDD